jgi:hypothetical protein
MTTDMTTPALTTVKKKMWCVTACCMYYHRVPTIQTLSTRYHKYARVGVKVA